MTDEGWWRDFFLIVIIDYTIMIMILLSLELARVHEKLVERYSWL